MPNEISASAGFPRSGNPFACELDANSLKNSAFTFPPPYLGMHQPLDGEEVWGIACPRGRIQQVSGQLVERGVERHVPEKKGWAG